LKGTIIARTKRGDFPAPLVAVPRQPWQWDRATVEAWLASAPPVSPTTPRAAAVHIETGRPATPPDDAEADREAWHQAADAERRHRAAVKKADRAHGEALYRERVAERLRREALERKVAWWPWTTRNTCGGTTLP
jgi:hypothetical protein